MDGRLLALAREDKEKIRRRSMAEARRRQEIAYGRAPRLRALDSRLAALVGEIASAAMGGGRPLEDIRRESLELQARRAEIAFYIRSYFIIRFR